MRTKLLFSCLLLPLTLGLFSCQKKKETSSEVERKNQIVLNASRVNLSIGESFPISVIYEDLDKEYETTYQNENDEVISIDDNGYVTALSEGESLVTVNKGDASATCNFIVSLNDQIPMLRVNGVNNHHLQLDLLTSFVFDVDVKFGSGIFMPDSLTYNIENLSGEGRMDGNTFVPTKIGDLNLEINASFRGNDLLTYQIYVEIKESVEFVLMERNSGQRVYSSIDLFTLDQYKEQTYMTEFAPVVKLLVNGEDKTNDVIFELIDEDHVVNYDATNKIITSNKTGQATLKLSYMEYSKNIPIKVNFVYIDEYLVEDVIIDASIGEFPSDIFNYFPDDKNIVKATSLEGEEYEVIDGKVKGIKSHNLAIQQIVLYNSKAACVVTFKAYAKVIREARDLDEFIINFGTDIDKVNRFQNDGYYILANDIDCSGVTYQDQTRVIGKGPNEISADCGFVGTFDGQGHVISNLNAIKGGLFLVLGNNAIVKNVAFKNVILNTESKENKFALATYVYAATIQNVYINSSSNIATQDNALVVGCFTNNAKVANCLFEYTGNVTAKVNYGSMSVLLQSSTSNDSTYNEVYVVSTTPITVNRKYYCDSLRYPEIEETFNYVSNTSIKHYLNYNDMKDAKNDFSSFNPNYWTIDDSVLSWKN